MLEESLKERIDAFRVLLLWLKEGAFIKESGLSPFAMELALGVCRRHIYLEYFISKLVKKMPTQEVSTILELGLYQMFFMGVPDYAAINTSVELAKKSHISEPCVRMINAVLHSARTKFPPELPPQKVRKISIENSVPEWLVRRWFDIYGAKQAEEFAKATLERPTEWLRVNLQKATLESIANKIQKICANECQINTMYDRYIQVPKQVKLKTLLSTEAFTNGEFSVQNPAAFEVIKLMDLKPNIRVWDACAAPGGKSALIAETDSSLNILASDVSENRVKIMRDIIDRLKLTNIRIECIDILKSENKELFDRILLDVPCSNLGVIARRPESIYRLTTNSLEELSDKQFNLLESAAKSLAQNGILVYATCSPDPNETSQVINRFLKAHKEFKKIGNATFPNKINPCLDGFFAQAITRLA